jgi:hypothetical protein
MSEIDEGTPARSKFWIWFLVLVLVILLMVPVLSIGLALKKTGWMPVVPARERKVAEAPASPEATSAQSDTFTALREKIEKVAATVVKVPTLHSRMQQVQIQTAQPSITKASEAVHHLLRDKNHQYVEAVSPDSIRIVVILPSNQWPDLSSSLQNAAEKDGFLYRGPNQTSTAGFGADSMVAEIEIVRKLPNNPKPLKASGASGNGG